MTRDEIIRMAREAGCGWAQNGTEHVLAAGETQIERFAALVAASVYKNDDMFAEAYAGGYAAGAAAEREACAKVAENGMLWLTIAKAIRARGAK